jgi:hypothetical protein
MPSVGRREPFRGRENELNPVEIRTDLDLATLRAAARSVHRGAWWRAARRDGWHRAPGVARVAGILLVLSCLAVGGLVSLPGPLGLFRGGDMTVGAADREGGRAGSRGRSGTENDAMRLMKLRVAAIAGTVLLGSGASAQSAIEWKISDGGNGHWYQIVSRECRTWEQCRDLAWQRQGYLATVNSDAERLWLTAIQSGSWTFLGGYQPAGSPEPSGGWRWVTEEPFVSFWPQGQPDNYHAPENCLEQSPAGLWNDIRSNIGGGGFNCQTTYAIEWSSDCNNDGVVDYGQILAGELDDANGNNIPDCCEQGTACPVNIAVNGSFEAGTPLNACTSETITSGTALGTGWMVNAGSVQRVRASSSCNTQGAPKFGDFFVDLLDAGEIRQAIATTPGKSYRLTFWLSGDCAGGPATKRVTASLGSATQNFDHACVGSAVQAWRSCTLEFIANSAITNLSLKSLAGGASNGPLVDGVRVEDISISCAGDVDGDGEVTGSDIGLVLLNFGPCPG